MKDMVTAARTKKNNDSDKVTFKHDGRDVTALRPKDAQVALIMGAISSYAKETDTIRDVIDFFMGVFVPADRGYFRDRLLDRDDDFEFEDLMEITFNIIEHFSENPSKPSSDSTGSAENSGSGSTATSDAKELTSSTAT